MMTVKISYGWSVVAANAIELQASRAYLQLGRRVGRIGREQLEHVDYTADGPRTNSVVLVLQQALVCQVLCDGHE